MLHKGTYDVIYQGDHIFVLKDRKNFKFDYHECGVGNLDMRRVRAIMRIIPGKGAYVGVLVYRTKSKGTMYGILDMKDCKGTTTLTLESPSDSNKHIMFELKESKLTIR